MADTSSKAAAPIASGGLLASLANTHSNGAIGRMKTVVCTREDPTGQGESFASERLRERSQQYADHVSGRAPLPPEISLWLRGEIDRLSQIVSPGQTSMWPDHSPAEKAYLAQREAARRRAANDLSIAVGGPVFSALPSAGRVLGAPEQTVEDLGRINAEIAGAKGLGRTGRGIEPVRVPTRMPQTSQTWRSPGNGVVVAAKEAGSIRNVNAIGGKINCVNCSIATDATLADRPASALGGGPFRVDVLEKTFGARFGAPSPIESVSEVLLAAGPGARGIVFGSRGSGEVGHVFNVANQNGVVRFLDGQTGGAASLEGYQTFQLLRTN